MVIEDSELQALLNEDAARTQKQLAVPLRVVQQTITDRLKAMRKIQKDGKWADDK